MASLIDMLTGGDEFALEREEAEYPKAHDEIDSILELDDAQMGMSQEDLMNIVMGTIPGLGVAGLVSKGGTAAKAIPWKKLLEKVGLKSGKKSWIDAGINKAADKYSRGPFPAIIKKPGALSKLTTKAKLGDKEILRRPDIPSFHEAKQLYLETQGKLKNKLPDSKEIAPLIPLLLLSMQGSKTSRDEFPKDFETKDWETAPENFFPESILSEDEIKQGWRLSGQENVYKAIEDFHFQSLPDSIQNLYKPEVSPPQSLEDSLMNMLQDTVQTNKEKRQNTKSKGP